MLRRRLTSTTRLRICPACGSDAVSSIQVHDCEESTTWVDVHCGACATWRRETLHGVRARIALARVKRIHLRQRRHIESDLRVLSAAHQPAAQLRAADR